MKRWEAKLPKIANSLFGRSVVAAGLLFVGGASAARASRSGLNNVPNADVSANGTGVVQGYSAFGEDRKPSFLTGRREGVSVFGERVETGSDTQWKPGISVPVIFNAK